MIEKTISRNWIVRDVEEYRRPGCLDRYICLLCERLLNPKPKPLKPHGSSSQERQHAEDMAKLARWEGRKQ